jgi:hypothetical protein
MNITGRVLAKSDISGLLSDVDANNDGQIYALYQRSTGMLKFRNRRGSDEWKVMHNFSPWTVTDFEAKANTWISFTSGEGFLNLYLGGEGSNGGDYILLASGNASDLLPALADVVVAGSASIGCSYGAALASRQVLIIDPDGALDDDDVAVLRKRAEQVNKLSGKGAEAVRVAAAKALGVKVPAWKAPVVAEEKPAKPATPEKKPTTTTTSTKKKPSSSRK